MPTKLSNPADIKAAFKALADEIGPRCWSSVGIDVDGHAMLIATIWPDGISTRTNARHTISVKADTWSDLLEAARAAWAESADLHAANMIKAIALSIIALTAEHRCCTDAALRVAHERADIKRYGERAVALANEMAANGPFSIVATEGANARAA